MISVFEILPGFKDFYNEWFIDKTCNNYEIIKSFDYPLEPWVNCQMAELKAIKDVE